MSFQARPIRRRSILTGLSAAAFTSLIASSASAKSPSQLFEKLRQPLGLQIGSLGAVPAKDLDAVFARLSEIGYREIELPNLMGRSPKELAEAASRAGLKFCSLHLPLMAMGGPANLSMLSEPARIADTMAALGAKWAVAPILLFPPGFRPMPGETLEATIARTIADAGEDIWKKTADTLNRRGEALKPLGIGVAYHNHNLDFRPIGKTTGWEILWRETQADLVGFEVDIGWVQLAGLDPVRFLRKAKGRIKLMHVRDMAESQPRGYRIAMGSPTVGTGRLDWSRIIPAAYDAGARHFIVEQEPVKDIAPLDAAASAFNYLARLAPGR